MNRKQLLSAMQAMGDKPDPDAVLMSTEQGDDTIRNQRAPTEEQVQDIKTSLAEELGNNLENFKNGVIPHGTARIFILPHLELGEVKCVADIGANGPEFVCKIPGMGVLVVPATDLKAAVSDELGPEAQELEARLGRPLSEVTLDDLWEASGKRSSGLEAFAAQTSVKGVAELPTKTQLGFLYLQLRYLTSRVDTAGGKQPLVNDNLRLEAMKIAHALNPNSYAEKVITEARKIEAYLRGQDG